MGGLSKGYERLMSSSVSHTQGSFGTYHSGGVLDLAQVYSYFGALHSEAGDGIVVEKLCPGPLSFTIPVMTVPVAQTISQEDKIILSLYYRWALQALSAFRFMHSRSVYVGFFSSQLVWIRSDFSLAVTGFISAGATGIEDEFWKDAAEESKARREESSASQEEDHEGNSASGCDWSDGEWAGDERMLYYESCEEDAQQGSVQGDL